jgi:hypothetical protein
MVSITTPSFSVARESLKLHPPTLGWLQTVILLISAPQAARIIDMSHHDDLSK